MGEFFQEPEFGKRFGKIARELTEREERLIRQKVSLRSLSNKHVLIKI
jgi:hypothetical protein